jgi:cell division protein FtsB
VQKRGGDWFGHVLDSARWRPQRQAVALGAMGLFVAVIMGALYLSQSAHMSALGRQLDEMIADRNDLEQSVEQLRGEIAQLQSMPRLSARAAALGFEMAGADEIIYIVVDGYNPEREIALQPLDTAVSDLPEYDETFGGWINQIADDVRRQFALFTQQ